MFLGENMHEGTLKAKQRARAHVVTIRSLHCSGWTASEDSFLTELPEREATPLPVPERSDYVAYLYIGRCKAI